MSADPGPGALRFRRILFRSIVAFGTAAVSAAGFALFSNNQSLWSMSRSEFLRKLDNSIAASRNWVLDEGESRGVAVNEDPQVFLTNAPLMHMVLDCARLSGDHRLESLDALYYSPRSRPCSVERMVNPDCRFEPPPGSASWSPEDYRGWFLYALAPSAYHLPAEARADMFSPDKYRTGRATHQLFALYLYRNFNGATPGLDHLIRHISARIASEAALDFRVTDLYLQRIAFLLAAGQADLVERRWVERALSAQRPDGGWSVSWYGMEPAPFRFHLAEPVSTSHPTVQGMWTGYMLKYRYRAWIDRNYR